MTDSTAGPYLLALFQKRIQGDDALLELARLRFDQAGSGPEFYAGTPDDLEHLWKFSPAIQSEGAAAVHLERSISLLDERSHRIILDFARRFQGRIFGLVVHDQPQMVLEDYVRAVRTIGPLLEKTNGARRLLIEYAAGVEPAQFIEFFERIRELECVSACIDVGHVGIRTVRKSYTAAHPGEDVCSLTTRDPRLQLVIPDLQKAVSSALVVVLNLIEALGALKKPLHVHLHDGHPLAACRRHGISDHLSFLTRVPIPFPYAGKNSLDPMYGPSGLSAIISKSLQAVDPRHLSFTLEVHPTDGRVPLGDAAGLFSHWQDKTNAERMNYWLSVLLENHQLVTGLLRSASSFGG